LFEHRKKIRDKAPMKKRAILLCGGSGTRFGGNKLFADLEGKQVFIYALEIFADLIGLENCILAIPEGQDQAFINILKQYKLQAVKLCYGGKERYNSVLNGLECCDENDLVAIHDAARPFIKADLVEKVYSAAEKKGGAILCKKVTDTTKRIDSEGKLSTLNREYLFAAETPQIFPCQDLKKALNLAIEKHFHLTDDAHAMELAGYQYELVTHEVNNRKITYSSDL
jgi:2-C-methyl-D-erythritol 4-phosphate cytidylyltransferase